MENLIKLAEQRGYRNHNKSNYDELLDLFLLQKWIRDGFKIHITIEKSWSYISDSYYYVIINDNDIDNIIQQESIKNRTYEQALKDSVLYVIENILNKKIIIYEI